MNINTIVTAAKVVMGACAVSLIGMQIYVAKKQVEMDTAIKNGENELDAWHTYAKKVKPLVWTTK